MVGESPAELDGKGFAALRGVTPPMVTRWKQAGLLVMTADGKRIRVAESIAKLDANLHPGRGGDRSAPAAGDSGAQSTLRGAARAKPGSAHAGGEADGAGDSYQFHAKREKAANATIAELALLEKAGKLVDREKFAVAYAKRVAKARGSLLSLPRRFASDMASDPGAAERRMLAKIREICTELADPAFGRQLATLPLDLAQDLRDAVQALPGDFDTLAAVLPRLQAACAALDGL